MARIHIRDLDLKKSSELTDRDLDAVVGGDASPNAPSVKAQDLLPQNVFPTTDIEPMGL